MDRVRIYTVNGGGFLAGKSVTVEATLWASAAYADDRLVIYYAPNANAPEWRQVGSARPTGPGVQSFSRTFTLSAGEELQAIRTVLITNASSSPCSSGSYADRDDVVFRLGDLPPQVALGSPGAVVSGTVTLSANVWDDFGVYLVNFLGNNPASPAAPFYLGAAHQAPYQFTWNTANYPDGAYELTAKAWDQNNQLAVSTPFTVMVDNTAPSVTLTAPATGAVLSGAVTLQASAQDAQGVARVEFYRDSTLLGTATQIPYQLAWNTEDTATGSYSLRAKAYDGAGNVSTSSVIVEIENGPTGSITSPAPQAVLSGTATFSVSAQSSQGIDRVTFYVGTRYITWDGTAPYTLNFNTLNFTNGDYVLTARIFDTDGNMTVTEGVTVTIQN